MCLPLQRYLIVTCGHKNKICRTSAGTNSISDRAIAHISKAKCALVSVKGTQSLIYIKQLLPLQRRDH